MADPAAGRRALFPRAWKYYDGVAATFALALMIINALIGADVFSATVDRWIGVAITAITAVVIWMRVRATQLGVIKVGNEDDDDWPEIPEMKGNPPA